MVLVQYYIRWYWYNITSNGIGTILHQMVQYWPLRWEELAPLATLGLQTLIVSNNAIVSIAVQEGEWQHLQCVSLDNNQVL